MNDRQTLQSIIFFLDDPAAKVEIYKGTGTTPVATLASANPFYNPSPEAANWKVRVYGPRSSYTVMAMGPFMTTP